MIKYVSWENAKASKVVLSELLYYISSVHSSDMKPYLVFLLHILLIQDSWQRKRWVCNSVICIKLIHPHETFHVGFFFFSHNFIPHSRDVTPPHVTSHCLTWRHATPHALMTSHSPGFSWFWKAARNATRYSTSYSAVNHTTRNELISAWSVLQISSPPAR